MAGLGGPARLPMLAQVLDYPVLFLPNLLVAIFFLYFFSIEIAHISNMYGILGGLTVTVL